MRSDQFLPLLGRSSEDPGVERLFVELNTLTRPLLDEDEPEQHFDWVLVRRKGIELGFVDAAYFAGKIGPLWLSDGLILSQITFYGNATDGVTAYDGELPHGLKFADTRSAARKKLAAHESTRHSWIADRWDVDNYRFVVAYKTGIDEQRRAIESVHIKLKIAPLAERDREQPSLAVGRWLELFGHTADDPRLGNALAPLDVAQRVEDEEDAREVNFISECGVTLYFEEARRLRKLTTNARSRGKQLVFGAVKFHRARDMEARQYTGELPFALTFDDSPETLITKLNRPPVVQDDSKTTGRALWHFDTCSLHVLYSNIDNHLIRIMLMAPGYWHELGCDDD